MPSAFNVRCRSLTALTAHHEPREQIEDRREVQLAAFPDHELRRVADPAPIRRVGRELPIEQIRGHGLVVVTPSSCI
jgi:hypothetical protein